MRNRIGRIDLALALEPLRRELIEPGEGNAERETDQAGDHQPTHNPIEVAEQWQQLRKPLRQRPHRRGIERGGADDIAALKFGKQAHVLLLLNLPCKVSAMTPRRSSANPSTAV